MSDESEFGRGVVVCLAKFSEHLFNRQAVTVMNEIRFSEMSGDDKYVEESEARTHPRGDAAQRIAGRMYSGMLGHLTGNPVSEALEMWANGASDHFYDLDRDRAPQPLCELADLTLEMGHGFTGKTWTPEHWMRIHDLWRESCLSLDRTLGNNPDWGRW